MYKKRVLFLCTGNSARSQMAEGFLKALAGEKFEVFSAGVMPIKVSPLAIKVMQEVGVDISKEYSKSVTKFSNQKFDYVITLCDSAKQTCPVFGGQYKNMHWSIEDPNQAFGTQGEQLDFFRKIRDEIRAYIVKFIGSEK
ncbi:MAG: arsenate reductase ArsC [Candidatus Omnitrophota bacterium]